MTLAREDQASLPNRLSPYSVNTSNSILSDRGSFSFCCTKILPYFSCSTLETPPKNPLNHMSSQRQVDHALFLFFKSYLLQWPWNKLDFYKSLCLIIHQIQRQHEASTTINKTDFLSRSWTSPLPTLNRAEHKELITMRRKQHHYSLLLISESLS